MKKFIIVPIIGLFVLTGCSYTGDKNENTLSEEANEPAVVQVVDINDGLYQIETETSKVAWDGSKITGTHHAGTINIKTGFFQVNEGDFSSGEVVIDMTTIESDEDLEKLVEHFEGDDFFSIDAYPESKLILTKMKLDQDSGQYQVEGDLTIKDVTNTINFMADISKEGEGLRIVSEFNIDRATWGIVWGDGKGLDSLKDKILGDSIKYNLNILAKI